MARQFQEVWAALEISNDDFIQTSEERHHVGCRKFIQAVYDAGDIYKRRLRRPLLQRLRGVQDREGSRGGRRQVPATIRTRRSTWVEEENYFFRLSAYRDRLLAHYAAHPDFIQPESRRNEIVSLVEAELQDVAITRKGFTWGIKVPFDPEQTIYVWFDALLNYITGDRLRDRRGAVPPLWPADVHVIGKDITRFHCALWPAMLMSAGLPLPRKVFGHGFVYRKNEETGEVQKISKSLGNVVEPMDLIEKFSSEAFRYYFMSQCPFGGDGEFSFERFADVYNSGPGQQPGEPLQPHPDDVRQVLRRPARRRRRRSTRPRWRQGLDLEALVGDLRGLIGSFEYNVALAADLAGGRRRRRTATSRRPSRSSWPRPTWRPAAPCWSTWPTGCGWPRS